VVVTATVVTGAAAVVVDAVVVVDELVVVVRRVVVVARWVVVVARLVVGAWLVVGASVVVLEPGATTGKLVVDGEPVLPLLRIRKKATRPASSSASSVARNQSQPLDLAGLPCS
jgi:hypothetical protein